MQILIRLSIFLVDFQVYYVVVKKVISFHTIVRKETIVVNGHGQECEKSIKRVVRRLLHNPMWVEVKDIISKKLKIIMKKLEKASYSLENICRILFHTMVVFCEK